mmetsp:Transcript_11408/g.20487  ORF Transcript_11408/g.20487 Transcript_11408/m.20487 type:complete len:322 (-) Transcript_11408:108-1073(-)
MSDDAMPHHEHVETENDDGIYNTNNNNQPPRDGREAARDNDLEQPLLQASTNFEASNSQLDDTQTEPSRISQRRLLLRSSTVVTHRDESYNQERIAATLWFLPKERVIPILVATADVTAGLASGMSIRFFSIFMYDDLRLSPIMVQIVYMVAPVLQIFLRKAAQRMSGFFGRCSVAVAYKWFGVVLMIAMVVKFKQGLPRSVVCAILVVRTAFMNSPAALTNSVLMDNVPKTERAKWAALESFNMFSWSGSAALGGILVDYRGILFNFCVTAGLQFIATWPLLFLSFFDTRREESIETARSGTREGDGIPSQDENDVDDGE